MDEQELTRHWMDGNFFTLRAGEQCGYATFAAWVGAGSPENPYTLAVMLLRTPAMPGEAHPESRQLTVLCAARYECLEGERAGDKLWGWVHLDPCARRIIGSDLEQIRATEGAWYVLRVIPPGREE